MAKISIIKKIVKGVKLLKPKLKGIKKAIMSPIQKGIKRVRDFFKKPTKIGAVQGYQTPAKIYYTTPDKWRGVNPPRMPD